MYVGYPTMPYNAIPRIREIGHDTQERVTTERGSQEGTSGPTAAKSFRKDRERSKKVHEGVVRMTAPRPEGGADGRPRDLENVQPRTGVRGIDEED